MAPTSAFNVLELPAFPLNMKTEAEAQIYRLICVEYWRSRSILYGQANMTWGIRKESISKRGVDKMTKVVIQYVIHNQISCRSEWETGFAKQKFKPDLLLR
jgi:hypothetical protein